jgi:hypothetical protein
MTIQPGTLCYIVQTNPANARLIGHVVEVLSPARSMPDGKARHQIMSPWLRAEIPRAFFFAAPSQLRPIAPPASPVGQHTRKPVQT